MGNSCISAKVMPIRDAAFKGVNLIRVQEPVRVRPRPGVCPSHGRRSWVQSSKYAVDTHRSSVLVTGVSGAGKSTLTYRLEAEHNRAALHNKLRQRMQKELLVALVTMLEHMEEIGVALPVPLLEDKACVLRYFRAYERYAMVNISAQPDLVTAITRLWESHVLSTCFRRNAEYELDDTAIHLLSSISEILDGSYPFVQCPYARELACQEAFPKKTSFSYGKHQFSLEEVQEDGGSNQSPDAVVYVAALDTYDVTDAKMTPEVTPLRQAAREFKDLAAQFTNTDIPVILVLTKYDAFLKKLNKHKNLDKFFPKYKGSTTQDALIFVERLFIGTSRKESQPSIKTFFVNLAHKNKCKESLSGILDCIIHEKFSSLSKMLNI